MVSSDAYQINLAAAALVFALFFFLVATVQALGQYFSTADGYRRCKASLVGHWAHKVRLRWRWRQLRFESMFTTPVIFLANYELGGDQNVIPEPGMNNVEWIVSPGSHQRIFRNPSKPAKFGVAKLKELDHSYKLPDSQDLACWLYLLDTLRKNEIERQRSDLYTWSSGIVHYSPACYLQE